ncbi:MAG: response regulator [Mucilaginibacter sp.]|nr:response regulator [Mucilaginibacter sp.]
MSLKVLIVEDQFLEANNLSVILKGAGHQVSGTAKSVDQALSCVRKTKPDIVLVDIYLKGDLTGIDLGYSLDKQNIPFIFLTANSNPTTLEEAMLTKPNGFLSKPFREREILMALNIASYRSQKNLEMAARQAEWLEGLLSKVKISEETSDEKLLMLIGALTSFLPFDLIFIDVDYNDVTLKSVHMFQRVEFASYERRGPNGSGKTFDLPEETVWEIRKRNIQIGEPRFLNGEDFSKDTALSPQRDKLRKATKLKSKLWFPLSRGRSKGMSISFYSFDDQCYHSEHLKLLERFKDLLSDIVQSIGIVTSSTRLTPREISGPRAPNQTFKPQIEGIIGNSPKLLEALDKVTQVAPFDNTALILGETGVGKEGLVRALHALSPRKHKPLIKVNCAAIPISLVESELFGHEKGSFTGAIDRRIGKFELAHGGTLFLDEIGELPIEIQSKLLRAIQEKEIERVGGRTIVKTDVRIVAATNRNLLAEISNGNFRMDLYYRINVFPITLPPLRERKEDIPLLVDYFIKQIGAPIKKDSIRISAAAMNQLVVYSWPGNIRELQNLIERHVLQSKSNLISQFDMPESIPFARTGIAIEPEIKSFDEMDRVHIVAALRKCNGKVSGNGGAAELLKLRPTTLNSKMKRLGINKLD